MKKQTVQEQPVIVNLMGDNTNNRNLYFMIVTRRTPVGENIIITCAVTKPIKISHMVHVESLKGEVLEIVETKPYTLQGMVYYKLNVKVTENAFLEN